jgi:hypothetical protein
MAHRVPLVAGFFSIFFDFFVLFFLLFFTLMLPQNTVIQKPLSLGPLGLMAGAPGLDRDQAGPGRACRWAGSGHMAGGRAGLGLGTWLGLPNWAEPGFQARLGSKAELGRAGPARLSAGPAHLRAAGWHMAGAPK